MDKFFFPSTRRARVGIFLFVPTFPPTSQLFSLDFPVGPFFEFWISVFGPLTPKNLTERGGGGASLARWVAPPAPGGGGGNFVGGAHRGAPKKAPPKGGAIFPPLVRGGENIIPAHQQPPHPHPKKNYISVSFQIFPIWNIFAGGFNFN